MEEAIKKDMKDIDKNLMALESGIDRLLQNTVRALIEQTEKQILCDMVATSTAKALTMSDIEKAMEALKPKKILVTSDIKLYSRLMSATGFNYRNLKYSPYADGTYIIDMEKLNKIKPLPYQCFDPME